MENKERARWEAEHQKEMKSLKEDIAKLTSLFEHALKAKSIEALDTQPIVAYRPTTITYFQNPSLNETSLESSYEREEDMKEKPVEEKAYEKQVALEKMMRVIEGSNLYDLVKATEMCLVSNVTIPKEF